MNAMNWEIEFAQDRLFDTYRERLIWMHHHEIMMWEFWRHRADTLPSGSYAREDARNQGEAHYRQGQGFMSAWKELNEFQAATHRATSAIIAARPLGLADRFGG